LHGPATGDRDEHLLELVARRVICRGEVTRLMVVVHEGERPDGHGHVECKCDHPPEVVLVRPVDKTVVVVIVQVVCEDQDVPDTNAQVIIEVAIRAVGVEHDEVVWKAVSSARRDCYVDAL
jgi:hypothetical protein